MDKLWFRPLVWLDYRLAVLFAVIIPTILIIWSLAKSSAAIERLLIIYWRVASLLMITIYFMIPSWPIAFVTGFAAKILIPLSLWFWVDLNDEIKDLPPTFLKFVTTTWRWAMTIYCGVGVVMIMPFLSCSFGTQALDKSFCEVWFQAPWHYKELMHANASPGFLGFLGVLGLITYVLYFLYFLVFRLGKQGRSALEQ
jgi:hypothetical protein